MGYFKSMKRCFIVAEISANHGQSFDRAVTMIKKAKSCGVDAVKFQTYTPDTITLDVKNRYFMVKHPKWRGQSLYQLYEMAYTPWKWFPKLKKIAEDLGMVFFSTAFDATSVDFLEDLGVPFHKIASFELNDLPLIEYAARTKKPVILSTGMGTMREIGDAVRRARKSGAEEVVLLKCVSNYPADPKNMNLKTIPHMKKTFRCPVGLSDHTLGTVVSPAAVCLGATVIEKHFTLSRKLKTPDSFFSLEPGELAELVRSVRTAEAALGTVHYGLTPDEAASRIFRRSLFVTEDVAKGEVFTNKNVRSVRPGHGAGPKYLSSILGGTSKRDIAKGTPLKLDYVVLKKKAR